MEEKRREKERTRQWAAGHVSHERERSESARGPYDSLGVRASGMNQINLSATRFNLSSFLFLHPSAIRLGISHDAPKRSRCPQAPLSG